MKLHKINPLNTEFMDNIGFSWHTDIDNSAYISDEIIEISQNEANAYYEATNELYDMFVEAGNYVVENDLFYEIGIPFNLTELVKNSWENDVHWHLYGRFDLAGGLDGKDIKLIEFNADTPTNLVESAIIQWAMLKFNHMDEAMQFNEIYEAISKNFKRLVTLNGDVSEFKKYYEGWKILFSCVAGSTEDTATTKLLENIANEAGFHTKFAYIDEVEFSDDGIFFDGENYEYLFKLIPWEMIAINEGELAMILNNIVKNQKAIILNPAYTLMFQSKGILKILWDLYPNHPLLLQSSFEPLSGKKQVAKPFLGREGANTQILDKNGEILTQTSGDYADQKKIYQEFYEFNSDKSGKFYQAGVFFAYEACGLGFRKGTEIIDNMSKFVGHFIKE